MSETVRVIGFDMAKSNAGWCLLEYNPALGTYHVLKLSTIKAAALARRAARREEVAVVGVSIVTFGILDDAFESIIAENTPDYVASESAWSFEFVTAYASLTVCNYILSKILKRYKMPLYFIAPKQAKLCLAGNGKAKKEEMIAAVKSNKNITFSSDIDVSTIDEHQADGIGMCVTFCVQLLPKLKK